MQHLHGRGGNMDMVSAVVRTLRVLGLEDHLHIAVATCILRRHEAVITVAILTPLHGVAIFRFAYV